MAYLALEIHAGACSGFILGRNHLLLIVGPVIPLGQRWWLHVFRGCPTILSDFFGHAWLDPGFTKRLFDFDISPRRFWGQKSKYENMSKMCIIFEYSPVGSVGHSVWAAFKPQSKKKTPSSCLHRTPWDVPFNKNLLSIQPELSPGAWSFLAKKKFFFQTGEPLTIKPPFLIIAENIATKQWECIID